MELATHRKKWLIAEWVMEYTYSLDKIKLVGKLDKKRHDFNKVHIISWIETLRTMSYSPYDAISENESLALFKYRFSYALKRKDSKDGVFYISWWFNGDVNTKEQPNRFMVEYNPNKSGAEIWQSFCDTFVFQLIDIKSLDIAYDLPNVDIANVYLDTKADVMTYGKIHNKTLYVSPRQKESGRVKVYQKDLENDTYAKNTLRVECSLKGSWLSLPPYNDTKSLEELERCVTHLNSVKIRSPVASDDWQVYALSLLPTDELTSVFSKMSNPTRKKYKDKLLSSSLSLYLDIFTFIIHLTKLIQPYERRFKFI